MKDLRENRFTQQTIARRVNEWSEAPALGIEAPGTRDYLAGFVRAVVQTLSPSSVRSFFRELDATDPVLSRLGWALLLVIPVFAALAILVPSGSSSDQSMDQAHQVLHVLFNLRLNHQSVLAGVADTKMAAHSGSARNRYQRCL